MDWIKYCTPYRYSHSTLTGSEEQGTYYAQCQEQKMSITLTKQLCPVIAESSIIIIPQSVQRVQLNRLFVPVVNNAASGWQPVS